MGIVLSLSPEQQVLQDTAMEANPLGQNFPSEEKQKQGKPSIMDCDHVGFSPLRRKAEKALSGQRDPHADSKRDGEDMGESFADVARKNLSNSLTTADSGVSMRRATRQSDRAQHSCGGVTKSRTTTGRADTAEKQSGQSGRGRGKFLGHDTSAGRLESLFLSRIEMENKRLRTTISDLEKSLHHVSDERNRMLAYFTQQQNLYKSKLQEAQLQIQHLLNANSRLEDVRKRSEDALVKAEHDASEAIKERRDLFQMLELVIVDRQGVVTTPTAQPEDKNSGQLHVTSFPNGDLLKKMFERHQKNSVNLFLDITELWVDATTPVMQPSAQKPKAQDYSKVLLDVFLPSGQFVIRHAELFVEKKLSHLGTFMDEYDGDLDKPYKCISLPKSLVAMFWNQTMQTACVKHMKIMHSFPWDENYCHIPNEVLKWALHDAQITDEGDHLCLYMKKLLGLHLFARFSQPQCYLYPDVGRRVEFSSLAHKQERLPVYRKQAQEGQLVFVLYPGLYFENPRSVDLVEPVVKATVILFPPNEEDERKNAAI